MVVRARHPRTARVRRSGRMQRRSLTSPPPSLDRPLIVQKTSRMVAPRCSAQRCPGPSTRPRSPGTCCGGCRWRGRTSAPDRASHDPHEPRVGWRLAAMRAHEADHARVVRVDRASDTTTRDGAGPGSRDRAPGEARVAHPRPTSCARCTRTHIRSVSRAMGHAAAAATARRWCSAPRHPASRVGARRGGRVGSGSRCTSHLRPQPLHFVK